MQERAATRQPDETICFRCSTVVKRDVGLCPECGSRIAAGPDHATPQSSPAGAWRPTAQRVDLGYEPPRDAAASYQDTIGVGRYVLNFVLAGFIGLAISYFLRREGWLATWISAAIFVLVVVITYMSQQS